MAHENRELLALFDREQRMEIDYPQAEKQVSAQIVRFIQPAPGMNFILYSDLDEVNADAVIEAQVAYFSGFDQPYSWKVYDHDNPPDLRDRLIRNGGKPDDRDAVLILDLSQTPESLLSPIETPLQEIRKRAGLSQVIDILEEVWGRSFAWVTDRLGGHLEIPGYLKVYVALADGRPGAVGWVYFHQNSQFASLWGGSTIEALRGRGFYTALVAQRVQEAIRRGYRYLVIDTSPMSRPIAEKHGFRLLTYAQDFQWNQQFLQG